jgi:hypothetical protein
MVKQVFPLLLLPTIIIANSFGKLQWLLKFDDLPHSNIWFWFDIF